MTTIPPTTRVVVLGAVSGNGGDAAILVATARCIVAAAPGPVVVDVVDYNPEVTPTVLTDAGVVVGIRDAPPARPAPPARGVRRVVRGVRRRLGPTPPPRTDDMVLPREPVLDVLATADVVVYTGGTTLVEHYALGEKFAALRAALLLGRPLVLATQSLGPFTDALNAERMKLVAERAHAVLLRDERSATHLRDIGADAATTVLPDVVFALADRDALAGAAARATASGDRPLRIAVSTRSWTHFRSGSTSDGQDRYLDAVAGAVTALVRTHDADVTFLSTCQGVASYWTDDSEVALAVAARLPDDVRSRVDVDRGFRTPDDLRDAYGGFDLVLATRMHAAILAMCAGTPVVAIAYEFKTRELFAGLGHPELAIDIEDVSSSALADALTDALGRRSELASELAVLVPMLADRAAELGKTVIGAAAVTW